LETNWNSRNQIWKNSKIILREVNFFTFYEK
jgi:hypothetical protein